MLSVPCVLWRYGRAAAPGGVARRQTPAVNGHGGTPWPLPVAKHEETPAMPIHEYECKSCGVRFERKQKWHEEPVQQCPECSGEVRKLLHPVGIVFKGSGFYKTDNRSSGERQARSEQKEQDKSAPPSESKPSDKTEDKPAKSEAKAETKSETKPETKSESKPEKKD
jgi:putative FmdB family regulatory protein